MNDFLKTVVEITRPETAELPHVEIDGKRLANVTPHNIVIIRGEGNIVIPRTGYVVRASETFDKIGNMGGIPIVRAKFGEPEIPTPVKQWLERGNGIIVSRIAAEAIRETFPEFLEQIYIPAIPVRDTEGNIIGTKALSKL